MYDEMEKTRVTGETRTVNIVYFLSRKGLLDQPHLIRFRNVHHNSGIRLRDVKRRLSELRGKGMPNSFVWSYKRRYRNGYVWQDIEDDDLITPICDNEYMLKGCELQKEANDNSYISQKNQIHLHPISEDEVVLPSGGDKKTKASADTEKTRVTHFTVSKASDDATTEVAELELNNSPMVKLSRLLDGHGSSRTDALIGGIPTPIANVIVKIDGPKPNLERGKVAEKEKNGNSNRISRVFESCCTTSAIETVDAAVRRINLSSCREPSVDDCCDQNSNKSASEAKKSSKRYKPVGLPNCMNCGKSFRPEKLHSHLLSCEYIRKLSKLKKEYED